MPDVPFLSVLSPRVFLSLSGGRRLVARPPPRPTPPRRRRCDHWNRQYRSDLEWHQRSYSSCGRQKKHIAYLRRGSIQPSVLPGQTEAAAGAPGVWRRRCLKTEEEAAVPNCCPEAVELAVSGAAVGGAEGVLLLLALLPLPPRPLRAREGSPRLAAPAADRTCPEACVAVLLRVLCRGLEHVRPPSSVTAIFKMTM